MDLMLDTLHRAEGPGPPGTPGSADTEQLLDWLQSGRLTLVDSSRAPLSPDAWDELPSRVRAQALEDFRRVVTGNAKAAVIFLRD